MTGIKLEFPYRVEGGDFLPEGATIHRPTAGGGEYHTLKTNYQIAAFDTPGGGELHSTHPPMRLIDGNARGRLHGHGVESIRCEPGEDLYWWSDPRRISAPPQVFFRCKCGHETPSYEQHIADVLLGATT